MKSMICSINALTSRPPPITISERPSENGITWVFSRPICISNRPASSGKKPILTSSRTRLTKISGISSNKMRRRRRKERRTAMRFAAGAAALRSFRPTMPSTCNSRTPISQRERRVPCLRKIAYRLHHRHAADQPGRERDREEGKNHAQTIGNNHAARLECHRQGKIETRQHGSKQRNQQVAGPYAEKQADKRSQQIIDGTFKKEHKYQVAALHTNGPRHSHLSTSLGGQQHKNQEDQQEADSQRKEAKQGKDA